VAFHAHFPPAFAVSRFVRVAEVPLDARDEIVLLPADGQPLRRRKALSWSMLGYLFGYKGGVSSVPPRAPPSKASPPLTDKLIRLARGPTGLVFGGCLVVRRSFLLGGRLGVGGVLAAGALGYTKFRFGTRLTRGTARRPYLWVVSVRAHVYL